MHEQKKFKHPSFGVINLNRVNGNATLFGSSVKHQHYISLTISKGTLIRDETCHYDHIMGDEELIRVSMSAVQLGEMLTNMNVGSGSPCTIERIMVGDRYEQVESPPDIVSTKQMYVEEFKENAKILSEKMHGVLDTAKELYEKTTATKGERKELLEKLRSIIQQIECNMPFVLQQFNEKVEKVVGEAKGEIEAFQSAMITQLGVKAIEAKALEGPK